MATYTNSKIRKIVRKANEMGAQVIVSNEAGTGWVNLYRVYEDRIRWVQRFDTFNDFMVWHANHGDALLDWTYMFCPYI